MNRHMAYPDADMTPENHLAMPYCGTCPDCGDVMWFGAEALVSLEHGGYVRCYGCYEPTQEEIAAAALAKSVSDGINDDLSRMGWVMPQGTLQMARVFRVHASDGFVRVSWTAPRLKGKGVSVALRPAEIAAAPEGPTKFVFSVFQKQMATERKGATKALREKLDILATCIDKGIMNPAPSACGS